MKKLQRYLICIIVLGISLALLVPGSIYLYWFANIQKKQTEDFFVKESYDNTAWIYEDLWNGEIYVESLAYSVQQADVDPDMLKDPEYRVRALQEFEVGSDLLIFGIDFFEGIEYYMDPALTGEKDGLYRELQEGKTRARLSAEESATNWKVAWENIEEAEKEEHEEHGLWIDPYYSEEEKKQLIANIRPVYALDGTRIGVTGVTYDFDGMLQRTDEMGGDEKEDYVLCDSEGQVLSSKTLPEISKEDMAEILNEERENPAYSCRTGDGKYTFYTYPAMNGQYMISYVKNSVLFKEYYRLLNNLVLTGLIILVVFLVTISQIIRLVFRKAQQDHLTSAWNQGAYLDVVQDISNNIHDGKSAFSIIVFDINGLKRTNDTLGHQAGDRMIQGAYEIIKNIFPGETIYRIGGDEFSVIFHDSERERIIPMIERFYREMDEYMNAYQEDKDMILISAGYATFDERKDACYEDTFQRADDMMYQHKKEFYDRYPEMKRS